MIPELNNILNITADNPPSSLSFLVTESKADSGFILHHFVSFYLRSGFNVCLVGLSQAYNHYRNVGTKLGVDLNKAKESGRFVFVEGLKIIGDNLTKFNTEDTPVALPCLLDKNGVPSVQNIYKLITDCVGSLENQNSPTIFLIDDIGVLLTLGSSPRDILSLLHYLRTFVCDKEGSTGCLLTGLHINNDAEDEDGDLILKSLVHQSDYVLSTYGLRSGYSKDVHGEMKIRIKDRSQSKPTPDRITSLQYKIMDKNVNFFALGTSSAVL